jgi:hypothetical protein
MAADLARRLGVLTDADLARRQDALLARLGLPTTHAHADVDGEARRLAAHCALDKKVAAGRTRSSTSMVGAPPVVMFTTQLERCLITLRNGANASGDWSGRPSFGSRACRCTIAAPASCAPIAASAISSAVIGRCGDMVGVWMAPVIAQVTITGRTVTGPLSPAAFTA